MKKLLLALTLTLMGLFVFNNAIGQTFEKGNSALNIGIGGGGNSAFIGYNLGGVGLSASYEVGLFPVGNDFGVIGLGALAGFRSGKSFGAKYSTVAIAPRGTFHFTVIPVEKLDVYAAVQVLIESRKIKYDDSAISNFSDTDVDPLNFIAGARYFFMENLAGFVEVGYSFTYFTAGASLKF